MALTFFKTPKNKKYNYKPLYYDPRKEEREKRLKSALEDTNSEYGEALRDRIQMRWKRTTAKKDQKSSNQRLIIILLIISLLAYLVFLR